MGEDIVVGKFGKGRAPDGDRLVLMLYVAATAPNSAQAELNLRDLLTRSEVDYTLDVVDCLSEPLRALRDGILVTPTLVKVSPEPQQTIIGTLRDAERLAAILGVATRSDRSGTDD